MITSGEFIKLVGKYGVWKCNKCGIVKEYMISPFTTSTNELMPTCGWACRKCGMAGHMVFQELIKT